MSSVLLWHPGASVATCDVAAGLRYGLEQHGVRVVEYPTDVQLDMHNRMLKWLWQRCDKATTKKYTPDDVIYKAAKEVLADACRQRRLHGTEWVIVVSGMYQHPDMIVFLRDCGFKVAVLLTESPYDTEDELRAIDRRDVTGAADPVANVVFTNERTAVEQFRAIQPLSYYLPHAWNPAVLAAEWDEDEQAHDVVFVGTYFSERQRFFADIDWRGIDIGLYGGTDFDKRPAVAKKIQPYIRGGFLKAARTAALYRRAKVGLNLHRTSIGFATGRHITQAESLNPRCYELAAMGVFFATDYRAELSDALPMVPTFQTSQECEAIIRRGLADEDWRRDVAARAKAAIQAHSWTQRAATVIDVMRLRQAVAA